MSGYSDGDRLATHLESGTESVGQDSEEKKRSSLEEACRGRLKVEEDRSDDQIHRKVAEQLRDCQTRIGS